MQQQEPKMCRKCKESRATILVHKDPLCRNCFIVHSEHLFKMTLRMKCQVTQKDERLLVCLSGGQNSTAMTKLMSDIVHSTCVLNKNKMFVLAEVLHIDETMLIQHFNQNYIKKDLTQFVREECDLPFHLIKLEDSFNQPNSLLKHIDSLQPMGSSREDFVKYLKRHLIYNFAIQKGFTKICFGYNGQRLAADLLSQLSKGKGLSIKTATQAVTQLSFPKQFFHNQIQLQEMLNLQILRPMKEFLNKEILYYLRVKSNDKYPTFQIDTSICNYVKLNNNSENGNIDHILENFVDKLQTQFPATTFTILSTADKATLKAIDLHYCPICLDQRDQIYNRLEIETLDNSNQEIIKQQQNNTRYFNVICFSCKRMISLSKSEDDFYNMIEFPNSMIKIGEAILEQKI